MPDAFLPEVHDDGRFRGAKPTKPNLSRFTGRKLGKNLRQLGAVGPYVNAPKVGSRHVIVKVGIIGAGSKTPMAKKTGVHFRYLERDGVGEEGRPAELIGSDGEHLDVKAFQQRTAADPHQYHLIVSPRDGDRLDMARFTRELMRQVERDTDRHLDYVAAIHYNTAHPHAHLVIRGRDLQERDLYFTKSYLYYGLRYRAMELATSYLGKDRSTDADQARGVEQLEQFTRQHASEMKRALDDNGTGYLIDQASSQPREDRQHRAGIAREYLDRRRQWVTQRDAQTRAPDLGW